MNIVKETNTVFEKKVVAPHTEETKKKLSEALKGRVHSEESKKKMSESQKGRKVSEEGRKNLSLYNGGNVRIRHIYTGEIFHNITAGALKYGIEPATLCVQLKSGYGKCLFEYVDKENFKRPIRLLRNKYTLEVFNNAREASESAGITISCLLARIDRNSVKNEFEFFEEVPYESRRTTKIWK